MKYLILFFCFFVGAQSQQLTNCDQIYFLFIGDNLNDYANISINGSYAKIQGTVGFGVQYTKYYNPSKPTLIYTNGWRLNYQSDDVKAVLGNYISARRADYNIIYLDWSRYTNNFVYITSLGAMLGTANTAYKIIEKMNQNLLINFNPYNTHFVGYDLGAHFMHMVAFEISYYMGFGGTNPFNKVDRLTGIDPAGLFQYGQFLMVLFNVRPIIRNTAKFTDVIHTSMNKFGYVAGVGNLDFYPNGGETQPGCTAKKSIQQFLANQDINQLDKLSCSHSRGWELYAESVLRPDAFKSVICSTFPVGETNCNLNDPNTISMGYEAGDKSKWPQFFSLTYGTASSYGFYVKTNDSAPYSLT